MHSDCPMRSEPVGRACSAEVARLYRQLGLCMSGDRIIGRVVGCSSGRCSLFVSAVRWGSPNDWLTAVLCRTPSMPRLTNVETKRPAQPRSILPSAATHCRPKTGVATLHHRSVDHYRSSSCRRSFTAVPPTPSTPQPIFAFCLAPPCPDTERTIGRTNNTPRASQTGLLIPIAASKWQPHVRLLADCADTAPDVVRWSGY